MVQGNLVKVIVDVKMKRLRFVEQEMIIVSRIISFSKDCEESGLIGQQG
jgi:hypothetical protein